MLKAFLFCLYSRSMMRRPDLPAARTLERRPCDFHPDDDGRGKC